MFDKKRLFFQSCCLIEKELNERKIIFYLVPFLMEGNRGGLRAGRFENTEESLGNGFILKIKFLLFLVAYLFP